MKRDISQILLHVYPFILLSSFINPSISQREKAGHHFNIRKNDNLQKGVLLSVVMTNNGNMLSDQ